MAKVLLLDIENQTKKLKELQLLLKQYDQVIVVYAASNLQIALDDLNILSEAIQNEKLLIIKMPQAGSDSADFGLTFIAGRLSEKLERNSTIDIMSDDRKLSYAVDLLNKVGMNANHLKNVEQELLPVKVHNQASLVQTPQKSDDHLDEKIMISLKILRKNQPKSLESLRKGLTSWCKISKTELATIIKKLTEIGCISIKDNKVSYSNKKIDATLAGGNKGKPVVAKELKEVTEKPHLLRVAQFTQYLLKMKNNKPSTVPKLYNSIKAFFKFEKEVYTDQTFHLLKKHKIFLLLDNKISYQEHIMLEWSN